MLEIALGDGGVGICLFSPPVWGYEIRIGLARGEFGKCELD